MKKYIILIIAVLGLLIMPNVNAAKISLPEKTYHEKVKVYLFRGEGCSHCYDFLSYFVDVFKDYEDYFEIVAYESWKDSANQNLMLAVKKAVGEEENVAVPFVVIGDDYHLLGFGDNSGEEIITPNPQTVARAAYSEGIKVKKEYLEEEGIKSKSGISDGVVIGIVFAVILLGFGGLVLISRK